MQARGSKVLSTNDLQKCPTGSDLDGLKQLLLHGCHLLLALDGCFVALCGGELDCLQGQSCVESQDRQTSVHGQRDATSKRDAQCPRSHFPTLTRLLELLSPSFFETLGGFRDPIPLRGLLARLSRPGPGVGRGLQRAEAGLGWELGHFGPRQGRGFEKVGGDGGVCVPARVRRLDLAWFSRLGRGPSSARAFPAGHQRAEVGAQGWRRWERGGRADGAGALHALRTSAVASAREITRGAQAAGLGVVSGAGGEGRGGEGAGLWPAHRARGRLAILHIPAAPSAQRRARRGHAGNTRIVSLASGGNAEGGDGRGGL